MPDRVCELRVTRSRRAARTALLEQSALAEGARREYARRMVVHLSTAQGRLESFLMDAAEVATDTLTIRTQELIQQVQSLRADLLAEIVQRIAR